MSDCCCNPGVGEPQNLEPPDYTSYRPGEVRLYGRPATCRPIIDEKIDKELEAELSKTTAAGTNNREAAVAAGNILSRHVADMIVGAVGENIALALLHGAEICSLPVHVNVKSSQSIGVIYGYAYEGHCYKLPKPQIMFLPSDPKNIVKGDCGCDCGYDPELGYAVWQIDKLESVIALDIRTDDLKTLILDENLPGNRSPLAYAQSMSLAPQRHRD